MYIDEERDNYISFLKDLIKDKAYVAFTYMTGILPIEKESSQSTINCFHEYSMLNDKKYYKYFGFTEQEVRDLCNNNEEKYKIFENWYKGYKAFNGDKFFNLWSVYHALYKKIIKNYWTETGRFDKIIDIIDFNIDGVKDEILDLIKGKEVPIKLENFGSGDLLKKSEGNNNKLMKNILYSKMVTYGFITYCKGKISIPYNELKEKFIKVLNKDSEMEYYYELIKISEKNAIKYI